MVYRRPTPRVVPVCAIGSGAGGAPGRMGYDCGSGLGMRRSPPPHLHWDWARPRDICTGTGPAPATSAPGQGAPLPHLHQDWGQPVRDAPPPRIRRAALLPAGMRAPRPAIAGRAVHTHGAGNAAALLTPRNHPSRGMETQRSSGDACARWADGAASCAHTQPEAAASVFPRQKPTSSCSSRSKSSESDCDDEDAASVCALR